VGRPLHGQRPRWGFGRARRRPSFVEDKPEVAIGKKLGGETGSPIERGEFRTTLISISARTGLGKRLGGNNLAGRR